MGCFLFFTGFPPSLSTIHCFITIEQTLLDLSSRKSVCGHSAHENVLQRILEFLSTRALLCAHSPKPTSRIIIGVCHTGFAVVITKWRPSTLHFSSVEFCGRVICSSPAGGFSCFLRFAKTRKYSFVSHSTTAASNYALKFVYNPHASVSKSPETTFYRRNVLLVSYSNIEKFNQFTKQIICLNMLSPKWHLPRLFTWKPSCQSTRLVPETGGSYRATSSCIHDAWKTEGRLRSLEFYMRKYDTSVTVNWVFCPDDLFIAPCALWSAVIEYLHSIHQVWRKSNSCKD